MERFWKAALAVGGLATVGVFVFWSLYERWLSLPIFSKMTSTQTFTVMIMFLVLVFISYVILVITYVWKDSERCANEQTEMRGQKEAAKAATAKFAQVAERMPELLQEMRQDLMGQPHVREFFVLLGGVTLGGTSSPSFEYRDSIHPSLMGKVHILENHGYLKNVTPKDCPKYRMTEEFVELLMKMPLLTSRRDNGLAGNE